jgi:hypothetical protein
MADAPKDSKDAEINALKAQLAAKAPAVDLTGLAEAIAAALAKNSGPKPVRAKLPLAEEHKGTHTYVVGPSKHYRNSRMYNAGELITVTDERPAKDWKLASSDEKLSKKTPVGATGRAADRNVG